LAASWQTVEARIFFQILSVNHLASLVYSGRRAADMFLTGAAAALVTMIIFRIDFLKELMGPTVP
jgi:hypothetical protein